ncbi:unnamed protein product [Trichobilharzia szidati]|nr:unnamed protein product [Trichobilharzia szidati]
MPFKKSCHLPRLYGYFRTSLSIDDSKVSKALLKQINLKGVKKISFSFNPLLEKTQSVRCLCTVLSEPRWRASNSSLSTKINVLSENRPPEVEVSYSMCMLTNSKRFQIVIPTSMDN